MNEKPTHRLVLHLSNGKSVQTEESYFEFEDPETEIVELIENRNASWKHIGHVLVNFRDVIAVEVEALATS